MLQPRSKKRIQLVDLLGERGHINYVKFYLDELSRSNVDFDFFTTKEYAKYFDEYAHNTYVLQTKSLKSESRWSFLANQLLLHSNLNKVLSKEDDTVFLSYDTLSLYIATNLSLLSTKNNVFLINHNNFDRAKSSYAKKIALQFLFKKYKMICIEQFMKEELKKTYPNERLLVLPHPIVANKNFGNIKEEVIFIPSQGNSMESIYRLDKLLNQHTKIEFVVKSKLSHLDLIHKYTVAPYFENYSELIANSKYVFLPLMYSLRVSAVFYEAAVNGCKILMSECLFAVEMKKLYPNLVSIIENEHNILNIDANGMRSDVERLITNNSIGISELISN